MCNAKDMVFIGCRWNGFPSGVETLATRISHNAVRAVAGGMASRGGLKRKICLVLDGLVHEPLLAAPRLGLKRVKLLLKALDFCRCIEAVSRLGLKFVRNVEVLEVLLARQ